MLRWYFSYSMRFQILQTQESDEYLYAKNLEFKIPGKTLIFAHVTPRIFKNRNYVDIFVFIWKIHTP